MDAALPDPLRESLALVADAMRAARDPWWIIASAAMALHGAHPIHVADVDLLTSERDAARLIAALDLQPVPPDGSAQFRSALFARWLTPALPVEIMAGFQVHTPDGWHSIIPATRHAVQLDRRMLFVPAADELITHCKLFARPKDEQRATILQRLTS
ncbi:MAG TPA: hypothetical protein VKQ09_02060 [Sphingomonas sp.]|nr:hypothetical protein [Sphingomonas sp.]